MVLGQETRFAALAQEIGERVVDRQLSELREAQRVHETFTELSNSGAGPVEILQAVQRMAAGPVVVENAQHRPLDYFAGPDEAGGFLDGWPARSRRVEVAGRTGWDAGNGWLVTRLGTADQVWGRLVIGSPTPPSQRLVAVAERAAAALALHRLHDRDRGTLMRRTHLELLSGLTDDPDSDDVLRRCELAGFPVRRRAFAGLVVRPRIGSAAPADLDEVAATVVRAAHGLRLPALVCEVERDLRVLVSAAPTADADDLVDRLAGRASWPTTTSSWRRAGWCPTAPASRVRSPRPARSPTRLRRSAASRTPTCTGSPTSTCAGCSPCSARTTGCGSSSTASWPRCRQHDRADGARTDLLAALRALVLHPASKTEAAASLHLSRAAFYDRLARIEAILDADLDDPDVRVSLHVALLAAELSGTIRPVGTAK